MPTEVWYRGNGVNIRYVGVKLSTIAKRGDIVAKNAVTATSHWVMLRARGLVPFKTGRLMASGRVRGSSQGSSLVPSVHKGRNISTVTFGNASVQYAVLQHQGDFSHPHGRIRLYLKVALDEANANNILGKALEGGMKTIHAEYADLKQMMIPQ